MQIFIQASLTCVYLYMHKYIVVQVMNPHTLTADGRCKIAMIRRKHIMHLDAAGKNLLVSLAKPCHSATLNLIH
jgi:hypothetical protein